MRWYIMLANLSNFGDAVTTFIGIKFFDCIEKNQMWAEVFHNHGLLLPLSFKLIIVLLASLLLMRAPRKLAIWVLLGTFVGLGIVTIKNLAVISASI